MSWRRNKLPYPERFIEEFIFPLNQFQSILKRLNKKNEEPLQLVIKQEKEYSTCLWDASFVLSGFLLNEDVFPWKSLQGKRCIEIGSGCGLSGFILGMLGASVILTELGEVMEILKKNLEINLNTISDFLKSQDMTLDIRCEQLFWGDDVSNLSPPFDIIIGSDVIYEIQAFDKLLRCLLDLSGPNTIIYIAFEHRWSDVEKFFFEEVDSYFEYENIDHKLMDSKFNHEKIDIYKFKRKNKSLN